jgi:hypothetical protein
MLLGLITRRYFGFCPLIRYLPVGVRSWAVSNLGRVRVPR